jgi:hypothetical protein
MQILHIQDKTNFEFQVIIVDFFPGKISSFNQ